MYKKILAAVNEHINSEMAAQYALHLAKACGCKLYLGFVADDHLTPESFRRAEDALQRLFLQAGTREVDAEIITEKGDAVRKIGEMVRREATDILFAATRREDLRRRFYVGTVARRLSLNLPCSVALVRVVHMGKIHPQKILMPLKARVDHMEERAYYAARMAQAFDAEIVVIHAPEPMTRFFHGEMELSPVEWEQHVPPDISQFMECLKRYPVRHDGRVIPGRAGRTITLEAFSKRHDLVLMGASRRGLLSTIFRGNPVEEVLRETPCNLIIFRPGYEDT